MLLPTGGDETSLNDCGAVRNGMRVNQNNAKLEFQWVRCSIVSSLGLAGVDSPGVLQVGVALASVHSLSLG